MLLCDFYNFVTQREHYAGHTKLNITQTYCKINKNNFLII